MRVLLLLDAECWQIRALDEKRLPSHETRRQTNYRRTEKVKSPDGPDSVTCSSQVSSVRRKWCTQHVGLRRVRGLLRFDVLSTTSGPCAPCSRFLQNTGNYAGFAFVLLQPSLLSTARTVDSTAVALSGKNRWSKTQKCSGTRTSSVLFT